MKNDFIHVRISSELKKQAQEYAREKGRSLANLIEYLLKQELSRVGKRKIKRTWYVLEYDNGNRAIFEEKEYFKEMEEQYGVDPGSLMYYGEFIVGVIESETKPTWDELVFDKYTGQYYYIYDVCNEGCGGWERGTKGCLEIGCPYAKKRIRE